MGKSPDEQPFLAAYKLQLAKLTLVPITRQLLRDLEDQHGEIQLGV